MYCSGQMNIHLTYKEQHVHHVQWNNAGDYSIHDSTLKLNRMKIPVGFRTELNVLLCTCASWKCVGALQY